MLTSRGAFFLGISLIICVSMFIYGPQTGHRYITVPTDKGVFIIDTKTQMVNLCTEDGCRVVPQKSGIVFNNVSTYGQFAPSVTSLGTVEIPQNLLPHTGYSMAAQPASYLPMVQQPVQITPQQSLGMQTIPNQTAMQTQLSPRQTAFEPQPMRTNRRSDTDMRSDRELTALGRAEQLLNSE